MTKKKIPTEKRVHTPGGAIVASIVIPMLEDKSTEYVGSTLEGLLKAFETVAKKDGPQASMPQLKRCAELFDPADFLAMETKIDSVTDGCNEEDVKFFREMLDHYTLHLVVHGVLYGLWAGATLAHEASGGVATSVSNNMRWTIARNLFRLKAAPAD